MTPKGNNIKVKQEPLEEILPSGIIIPQTVKNPKLRWGEVVEIGNISEDIKSGDRVYYNDSRAYREKIKKSVLPEETGYQLVSIKDILYVDPR